MNQLASVLDRDTFNESQAFTNRVRETRHLSIMVCQKAKFNRLWHKTTGGCPNIRKGNDSSGSIFVRYMCTINGGQSNAMTSGSYYNLNSSTATAVTTTITLTPSSSPIAQAPYVIKAKGIKTCHPKPSLSHKSHS